ncbi:MAG: hypothetical protein NZ523_04460 [Elioraea sp.]|nr:hypothetical protein [Elioraea sp.]
MSDQAAKPSRQTPPDGRRLPLPAWVALVILLTALFLALGRALG